MVTLIGEKIAEEGVEFVYLGPSKDCRSCKLKTVCFNLKQGRHYRITKVREKRHACSLHDGNAAVIEVQELPILTTVDKKIDEGYTAKIEEKACQNIGCPHYPLCHNVAIQKNKNYKIIKVYDSIYCPQGYELKKAEVNE
jgi:hypothetical protein